jgi:hypothetical protein
VCKGFAKAHRQPAQPPADDYGLLDEEAAQAVLGRHVYTKAIRSWALRPARTRDGSMLFRRGDVEACRPRVLPPAVRREVAALRAAVRAAGLGV